MLTPQNFCEPSASPSTPTLSAKSLIEIDIYDYERTFFSSCPFKQTVSSWHFFRERAIFPDYTNLVLHLIRFIIMGFIFFLSLGNGQEKKPPRSSSNDSFINFTFHFVVNLSQRNYFHLLAGVFPAKFSLPNPKSNATGGCAFRNDTSRKHLLFFVGSVAILSPNWTEALNSVFGGWGWGTNWQAKARFQFGSLFFTALGVWPSNKKNWISKQFFSESNQLFDVFQLLARERSFPSIGKNCPTPHFLSLSLESVVVVTSSKADQQWVELGQRGEALVRAIEMKTQIPCRSISDWYTGMSSSNQNRAKFASKTRHQQQILNSTHGRMPAIWWARVFFLEENSCKD